MKKKSPRTDTAAMIAAVALFSVSSSYAANSEPLPVRRPGHWQITSVVDPTGMNILDVCVGASDSILPNIADKNCTPPHVEQAGRDIIVNQTCKTDDKKQFSSSLLSGDYQTWYRIVGKITFDPPQSGVHMIGLTITAKYISDKCPDDTNHEQKP